MSLRAVWSPYDSDSGEAAAETGAGVVDTLIGNEAQDFAARAIADKLQMIRYMEPAVRAGLRMLPAGPSSPHKDMAIEILDEWAKLEKENSKKSQPNLLHFTYMSLVMAQSLVMVLGHLVKRGGGGNVIASRAIAALASQMQSRLDK